MNLNEQKIYSFLQHQKRRMLKMDGATEETGWLTERERKGVDFVARLDEMTEDDGRKVMLRQRNEIGLMEILYENTIDWIMRSRRSQLRMDFVELAQPGAITEDTKLHKEIVRKTGKLDTLATSSLNFDQRKGGDDIYYLMPVLAYKLDKEIRAQNPRCGIDEVFSSVCKNRHNEIDILFLIKEISGYDPNPLFKKYFYSKVEKSEDLLK